METPLAYLFPPYRLVPARRLLLNGDTPVKLGGRAFDMLVALVERRERTVSKHELMEIVWPRLVVEGNNLQVQVVTLRKLLGHPAVATVPGRGYRFSLPVETVGGDATPVATRVVENKPAIVDSPTNLPHWLPTLWGRAEELRVLMSLMDQYSWVTVVGPAGIGKTRLSQAAATLWAPKAPGGVWWADLSSLEDPTLVPNVVALAMGLDAHGGAPTTEVIASALLEKEALIVLDNAEHLLDGIAHFLARLRPAAGRLQLLVTSQEILHAADEHVYRLEPLSLPGSDAMVDLERSGAVALFMARAQASDRLFKLDADNGAIVAEICRRLDGIPLAIELAAARLALLGVEGLVARLDHRFQVLTSGDRTAQRRHRTLREALEWSHRLLSPPEGAVFRRLGVFAGGFTLEAAQDVAEDDRGIDRWDVLEHLGALVDKSLVMANGDLTPRYRLLETMRLFALERLIEHDEVDAARSAHRDHFMGIAESARGKMASGEPEGLRRLDLERDNLSLALAWTRDDDDGSHGLRLAEAMRLYWTSRGLWERGLEKLRAALAHPGIHAASVPRCRAEIAASTFCLQAGLVDEAVDRASRAVVLARELYDDGCLCAALSMLGNSQLLRGETAEAARLGQEAIALARRVNDSRTLGFGLGLMSAVHSLTGHHDLARAAEEECLALRQRSNDVRNQAVSHLNLAWILVELGQVETARRHLGEVVALLPTMDSEYHGVELIHMTGNWAACTHRNESAVLLYAAYSVQCSRVGITGMTLQTAEIARLRQASDALAESARSRAQTAGRTARYGEALDCAIQLIAAR